MASLICQREAEPRHDRVAVAVEVGVVAAERQHELAAVFGPLNQATNAKPPVSRTSG